MHVELYSHLKYISDNPVSLYLAMPALELRCTLYSFWARRDKKWVTTNADEKTDILLSLLSSEDDPDKDDMMILG